MYYYICNTCSKNFESPKKDRKYCGKECTAEGNRIKEPTLTKVCPTCKIEKAKDSFWKRKDSINGCHSDCIECAKKKRHTPEYREKRRPLERKKRRKYLGLDPNFEGNYKTGPKRNPNTRTKNQKGYWLIYRPGHPNAQNIKGRHNKGRIFEHVFVMSEHLGRPLKKDETVHHKNGIRDDNRIENLELWKKGQPPGSREDKIQWAKELLEEYGYDVVKR